jgi:hypothetical protein
MPDMDSEPILFLRRPGKPDKSLKIGGKNPFEEDEIFVTHFFPIGINRHNNARNKPPTALPD